ncbi:hypothetical protein YTPLAS73_03130 [Nitrosarchaeum sp.]|nr:hypothetical protein YTPLAS73_03130 [Nitrosarchaeum sp.]
MMKLILVEYLTFTLFQAIPKIGKNYQNDPSIIRIYGFYFNFSRIERLNKLVIVNPFLFTSRFV